VGRRCHRSGVSRELAVRYGKAKEQRKEKEMIARFDHRPMLTAVLALSTTVLVVVVITLSALLITSPQAASPPSDTAGGKPAGAAPANMDAGGENYGWDIANK
jgi:heme/copper-type cytochrome/quinol oxidase subunit 2